MMSKDNNDLHLASISKENFERGFHKIGQKSNRMAKWQAVLKALAPAPAATWQ